MNTEPKKEYLTSQLRFTPALILMVLLSGLLSGCVGYTPPPVNTPAPTSGKIPAATRTSKLLSSPNPPEGTPTSFPAVTPVSSGELSGASIVFWYAGPPPGQTDLLQTFVDKFNTSNGYGIHASAKAFSSYGEIVDQLASTVYGEKPDIVLVYPYQARRLDASGSPLVNLDSLVTDPQWGFTPGEVQDFQPVFWQEDVRPANGNRPAARLGVPFYRSANVLLYNSTWAQELGFQQPPASQQDFQKQACAAAKKDPATGQVTGGYIYSNDAAALMGWMDAFGGSIYLPSSNSSASAYRFDVSEVRGAFSFLRGLLDSGCAWVSPAPHQNVQFASHQALFISSSLGGLPAQEQAFLDANRKDSWTALPYPSSLGKPAIDVYGPSLAILQSTSPRQVAAWLLLKALVSPDSQARWVEAHGDFPVRSSIDALLSDYESSHPQWQQAFTMLETATTARIEPSAISWIAVRKALSDAGRQLYSASFKTSQVEQLVKNLQTTANELDAQMR